MLPEPGQRPESFACRLLSVALSYLLDIHQFIGYGINSETCHSMDLQLARYVPAVGSDSVHRKEESLGNLLVAHPLGHIGDNVLLPLAQNLGLVFPL